MYECSCCGTGVPTSPCCITYNEPIYDVLRYHKSCIEGTDPLCYPSSIVTELGRIPRVIRNCGSTGGEDCYVRKVVENYSREAFGCPDDFTQIEYYVSSHAPCLPGEDLGNGIICPLPDNPGMMPGFGFGFGQRINRTIEKIYGTFDPKYLCKSRRYAGEYFTQYIQEKTPSGVVNHNNWFSWWEEFCSSCDQCNKRTRIYNNCVIGGYDEFIFEEGTCSGNYCITGATYNISGDIVMGVTSSISSTTGKHFSINENSWKGAAYCYDSECLVNKTDLSFGSPYIDENGNQGVTACIGVDNCFLVVKEAEADANGDILKIPNPRPDGADGYGTCNHIIEKYTQYGPLPMNCWFPNPTESKKCDYGECENGGDGGDGGDGGGGGGK